jgi:hypothetical protein
MKVARQLAVSALAVAVMLALGFWGLSRTSAHTLAIRWNPAGQPIAWADRYVAFFMVPAIGAVMSLFLGAIPGLMPERSRIERSGGAYTALWMVSLFAMVVAQFVIVALNTGIEIYAPRLIGVLVAVTLFVTGNWMGKIRYNYLFGIRTPWTLADERVWDKTHRFTGRLLVLAAVIVVIASFVIPGGRTPLAPGALMIAVILVCALAPLIAGVVYSIIISRSSRKGRETQ